MDDLIKQIRELREHEVLMGAFAFTAVLAPGILTLWVRKPVLIESAGSLKIFLLALSITVPILFVNMFSLASKLQERGMKESDLFLMAMWGVPPLMFALLSMDFLCLIFPIHIALFVAAVAVIDVLGIIASYYLLNRFKIYEIEDDGGQKTS